MKLLQKLFLYDPKDFIHLFLEKNEVHPYFNEVFDNINKNVVYEITTATSLEHNKRHYVVFDIPGYYKTKPNSPLVQKKIKSFKGSLIHLSNYTNYEHFISEKFTAKHRGQLKRQESKLFYSFKIEHRMYFGEISEQNFNQLFEHFKNLLICRFQEKGIKNDDLPHWSHYRNTFFGLLLEKRACISVLYHNDIPISFSVNLIYGTTMYGYLKSYDINFSKYSIGVLETLKLMQWAFEFKMYKFDLLKGQYPYKTKLIDQEYFFYKNVLYDKTSMTSTVLGHITFFRISVFYRIIRILKMINIHRVYRWFRTQIHRRKNTTQPTIKYDIVRIDNLEFLNNIEIISSTDMLYMKLRKPLYDFLFSSEEKLRDVVIYRVKGKENRYLFKGKKKKRVISLSHTPLI